MIIGAGERLYKVSYVGGSEVLARAYNPDEARRIGRDYARKNKGQTSSTVVLNAALVKETKEEREANKPHVTTGFGHVHKITPEQAKFTADVRTVKDAMNFLKKNPGTEFFKVSFDGVSFCFYNDEKDRAYCENYLREVIARLYRSYKTMDIVKLHSEMASVETRGRLTPSNDLRWQYARVVEEIRKRLSK